jgi:pyruvate-ferredoxin/flavodoxin oxidoreductase
MSLAERDGLALIQLKRFSDPLVKQAYKLSAGDDMHRYTRVGSLLDDAFAQLIDKLGLDAEKRAVIEHEYGHVRARVEHVLVARTETFFTAPHGAEKGSGAHLSIALNPLACTGCGVCIDVCPEGALAWATQTPGRLDEARARWAFQRELPPVPADAIERFVADDRPETFVHRLLDRDAYHSLVGGDGSYPGNSAKTAVHLVAAAVEAAMKPRIRAHVARLDELIARLEKKIQGDVSDALRINDFDAFARRLDRMGKDTLTPDALASVLGAGEDRVMPDPERLRRLTRVLDALKEQKRLYVEGADGHGRARMAMAIDAEGLRLWSGTYPYNPLPYPWACHVPGGAADLALGLHDGIERLVAGELAACRQADLELSDAYDPSVHDALFDSIGAGELSDAERRLVPPVIVLGESAGAGATRWDDVAGLLAGTAPIMTVLIDPVGESVDGWKLLSLARDNPRALVVQASVGYPGHLMRRVAEAIGRGAPALFHVHAPDPIACGLAPGKTAAQARLAVEARVTPLFTATGASVDIDDNPGRDRVWPVRAIVFREPSGTEASLDAAVTVADWAIHAARFQEHFTIVPKGRMSGQTKPLSEYVDMDAQERAGLEPFIHFAGRDQRHVLAVVGPEIVRATESRRDFWLALRVVAAGGTTAPQPAPVAAALVAPAEGAPAASAGASAHQALTEQLLRLCGFSADPDFFKQSLREFVVQRNVDAREDGAGE